MNYRTVSLAPGLYFVATPIGTARDITLRALDVLASADVIAAEDTRSLRHLMEIHGVPLNGRRIIAYHDHSGKGVEERLLSELAEGRSLAYASEAGMPLIADPGYELSRAAAEAGQAQVIDIQGALVGPGETAHVHPGFQLDGNPGLAGDLAHGGIRQSADFGLGRQGQAAGKCQREGAAPGQAIHGKSLVPVPALFLSG